MTTTALKNEEKNGEVAPLEPTEGGQVYTPRFDIWETADELVLCGDLPGVRQQDLEVRFENRQLTVHGKVEPRSGNRESVHQEYGVGHFHRTFAVGESIDPNRISAELSGGVLTLHLPKSEAVKPRKIEVRAANSN